MKEHHYELRYFNGKCETLMKFPGDINLTELYENLRCFLFAAGWHENNIARLFNEEESKIEQAGA